MLKALTCVIVISSGHNGDWTEKYWHEMAHCNGWEHGQDMSSFKRVYSGKLDYRHVTTAQAKRLCDGHVACMWFER